MKNIAEGMKDGGARFLRWLWAPGRGSGRMAGLAIALFVLVALYYAIDLSWMSPPRYQIAATTGGQFVRLDTKTGEMRVYAVVPVGSSSFSGITLHLHEMVRARP